MKGGKPLWGLDTRGVTAVELMITVGIIGLMALVTIPLVGELLPSTRVKGAAEQVASAIRLARQEAITRNQTTCLNLDATAGTMTITLASGSSCSPGGASIKGPDTIVNGATIVISTGSSSPSFSPTGAVSPAGTISVTSQAQTLQVIYTMSGRVRIQ